MKFWLVISFFSTILDILESKLSKYSIWGPFEDLFVFFCEILSWFYVSFLILRHFRKIWKFDSKFCMVDRIWLLLSVYKYDRPIVYMHACIYAFMLDANYYNTFLGQCLPSVLECLELLAQAGLCMLGCLQRLTVICVCSSVIAAV